MTSKRTSVGEGAPRLEPRIVRLDGGRSLAFSELGDPAGFPIISCHGGLIGRRDVQSAHAAARRAGVWLLSPDRPGIGASDPAPGRTLLDWPRDLVELADRLLIDRVAVMGWSVGCTYALACAHQMDGRLVRTAVVAPNPPLDDAVTFAALNRMDTTLVDVSRRAPRIGRAAFGAAALVALHLPRLWIAAAARSCPPVDARAVRRLATDGFASAQGDALRTGAGLVADYVVWGGPWGFRLEDISAPVDVWHGELDTMAPAAWSDEVARRLPRANRKVLAGAGHFLETAHYEAIFTSLLPPEATR